MMTNPKISTNSKPTKFNLCFISLFYLSVYLFGVSPCFPFPVPLPDRP
jgi:hypothetical protein